MLKSVFSNWFGLVFNGLVSFLLTPLLIHHLGTLYYGMWILAASLLDYYGLLDIGMRTALFRFVARANGASERKALNTTINTALAITAGIGLFLVVLIPALTLLLPGFFDVPAAEIPNFRWLLILVGLSLAITFPARVLGTYLSGLQRFDLYNLSGIATTLLRACMLIVVLFRGHGVVAVAAVTLVSSVFSFLLNWKFLYRADRDVSFDWSHVSWTRAVELIRYGFYAFLNTAGEYLRSYTDAIVIARMLGVALVAPFSIATRMMEYFKSVFSGIGSPMMGVMSEIDGKSQDEEQRRFFLRSTRLLSLASVLFAVVLILDGKAFIHLWVGDAFISTYPLIVVLTAGYALGLGQYPSQLVVFARAQHRPLALLTLAEGIANLVLSIYWARRYGLMGVALGTAVPMIAAKLIQPWYALHVLKISGSDYLTKAIGRPLIVLGLFAAFGRLIPAAHGEDGLISFFTSVAGQTALFAILTYAVGLNSEDRRFVWDQRKYFKAALHARQIKGELKPGYETGSEGR